MSDLKLFRVDGGKAEELRGSAMELERELQKLIESNMETFFGVTFLVSEYHTGPRHKGRIDSIGIDENGSPVIVEYKRSRNENIINQGLFYLDWLMDHRAEFESLAKKHLGKDEAEIDWTNPRLICVAGDFSRYDQYAVQQIDRSIELIRYRDFDRRLIAFELLTTTSAAVRGGDPAQRAAAAPRPPEQRTVEQRTPEQRTVGQRTVGRSLEQAGQPLQELFHSLDALLLGLGDDIARIERKHYFAYRRLKNFACVEVHPQSKTIVVYAKADPASVELVEGFTRDVRGLGHFGTGDLEIRITDSSQLAKAEPLLAASYTDN